LLDADLTEADLRDTVLENANFRSANLKGAIVDDAIKDAVLEDTIMPDGQLVTLSRKEDARLNYGLGNHSRGIAVSLHRWGARFSRN